MRDYLEWMQSCAQLTVTGCPCISIPAGFDDAGLPIGLQITAPPRADARLLAFARMLESIARHADNAPRLASA
jgi:amidase